MMHHPSSDGRFGGALAPGLGWVHGLCAIRVSLSLAYGSHSFRMVAHTAGQAIKAELRFNSREESIEKNEY
jgi:hypothetical protein